jgi:hypothetical protein
MQNFYVWFAYMGKGSCHALLAIPGKKSNTAIVIVISARITTRIIDKITYGASVFP